MKPTTKTLLALVMSATLIGCGGSDSNNSELESKPSAETYACDPSQVEVSNTLRTYQIMVESFVSGDSNIGHGTGYGTSHHNGDLQGIIDSLDYIKATGANAIWLTPIFHSAPISGQDHWADRLDATGYFTSDYFSVDPRFGDMATAKELVETAHEKGLYVFFDGVFGHHKGNVVASPSGLKPEGSSNPVSYPGSLDFYKEVATYWIEELKIDGWRLDQAYQVPTEAWTEIRKAVDEASQSVTYTNSQGENVHPLGYMVAEIWSDEDYIAETGYGPTGNPALCSAFDFPMRYRIVETLAASENNTLGRDASWLANGYDTHDKYPEHAKPNLMLGNHDLVRFGDLLQRGNIAQPSEDEYWLRHKAAFAFQASYTGPITLYYGEEIGDEVPNFDVKEASDTCAEKGLCDDHVARSSAKIEGMTGDVLTSNQSELRDYVAELMAIRDANPALYKGSRLNIVAQDTTYIDLKTYEDNKIVYAANLGENTINVTLSSEQLGTNDDLVDLMSNQVVEIQSDNYQLTLQPFEARFLRVNPN
ncbi:alpha-amylase family glycosyl hydrolase [Vibrio breoganii]|nr:alpha-amylase family glycosyl hydrolase [Vibrio breoganii]